MITDRRLPARLRHLSVALERLGESRLAPDSIGALAGELLAVAGLLQAEAYRALWYAETAAC